LAQSPKIELASLRGYLPGYSPDFNPIERLWLRLKADFFSDFIAKSTDELTLRLCHALTSFMNDPPKSCRK
jgi:transposase